MKRNHFNLLLVISLILLSCNDSVESKESKPEDVLIKERVLVFDKLLGTWKAEDGKSFERWIKNPDGSYASASYSLSGADTSWNEMAKIYPDQENWIFENNVKGQNNGQSVRFTSTLLTDSTVQFSNPNHDFPTDVNYTLIDSNNVHAFIIGPNKNGGRDTIPFNYTKLE